MFYRLTARVLLACYGVIALWGQGLHEFLDDDGDLAKPAAVVAVILVDVSLAPLAGQANQAEPQCVVQSPSGGHCHDCDHCPICQFQSMGQHFAAPPPAETVLAVCELLSPGHTESVHCPALFSPAQPRAPPIV
jgi:hypothetical protein